MSLSILKVSFILFFVNISVIFVNANGETPQNCLDEKCSVPISEGYTVMGFSGDHNNKLAFKAKDKVIVYGKPPSKSDSDLWFVQINEKRGFVAKRFLKETKMYRTTAKLSNEAELKNDNVLQIPADNKRDENLQNTNDGMKVITDFNKTIIAEETTIEVLNSGDPFINDNINASIEQNSDGNESDIAEDEYNIDKSDEVIVDVETENDDDILFNDKVVEQPIEVLENKMSELSNLQAQQNEKISNNFKENSDLHKLNNTQVLENENLIHDNTTVNNSDSVVLNNEDKNQSNNNSFLEVNSKEYKNISTELYEDKPVSESLVGTIDSPVTLQSDTQNDLTSFSDKPHIEPNKPENIVDGTTLYDFDVNHASPNYYEHPPNAIAADENQLSGNIASSNLSPFPDPSVVENRVKNEEILSSTPSNVDQSESSIFSNGNEINNESKTPEEESNLSQNKVPPKDSINSQTGYQNNFETASNKVTIENTQAPDAEPTNTYPYDISNLYSDSRKEGLDLLNNDSISNINAIVEDSDLFGNVAADHFPESINSGAHNLDSQLSDDKNDKLQMDNLEDTENAEQNSLINTLLTMLPLKNLSSLLLPTLLFSDGSYNAIGIDFAESQPFAGMSARMVLFLFIVSVTVLTFTLGYYFLDVKRQDGKLVGMVNSLQKDLLCYTKECDMLKDELYMTKEKLAGIEDSSFGTDEMVISLKQDIQRRNVKIEDLENELEKTVKELQSTSRASEQLQSFIDEVLQWKDQTKLEEDMANIEQLQEENDKLISELETARSEEGKAGRELEDLKKQYDDATNVMKVQQHEIDSLKDALSSLDGNNITNTELSNIINQSEIKAQLKTALQEKDSLSKQIEDQKNSLSLLEAELKTTIDSLQKSEQATTRLEVLCDHFKKRETDLAKELSSKETLWLSTHGETMTTIEKMQALQAEVQQYKDMCMELRRELADAEASRRSDEAELEKRAHSAWLDARKAQREAEAHKAEAAALRRRLAAPSTNVPHSVTALSPPLPLIPPPLPPPMLPPLARPPPLGRHPSPPFSPTSTVLANSPPPRYSDYISDRDYPERRGRSPYSPVNRSHQRRRSYSNERYYDDDRRHNHMTETETDYSPPPSPRRRRSVRSPRHGPSSGSGQSSDSDK